VVGVGQGATRVGLVFFLDGILGRSRSRGEEELRIRSWKKRERERQSVVVVALYYYRPFVLLWMMWKGSRKSMHRMPCRRCDGDYYYE